MLYTYTIRQLKKLASSEKIKYYGNMTKAQLVEALSTTLGEGYCELTIEEAVIETKNATVDLFYSFVLFVVAVFHVARALWTLIAYVGLVGYLCGRWFSPYWWNSYRSIVSAYSFTYSYIRGSYDY